MKIGQSLTHCLADPSAGPSGTGLVLWGCQNNYWFAFTERPTPYHGGGFTYVQLEMANSSWGLSGLCIDMHAGAGNQQLRIWNCNGTNSQAFAAGQGVGPNRSWEWWNGYYNLDPMRSNCINDYGGYLGNGNIIWSWPCHDTRWPQYWLGP
jgi:hypothetical protein